MITVALASSLGLREGQRKDCICVCVCVRGEEVEAAVKSLKKGKSAGADNVPAELIQAGGEAMISALLTICYNYKIWQTGVWLTPVVVDLA